MTVPVEDTKSYRWRHKSERHTMSANPAFLLRKPAVLARTGIPRSTWDRGVRMGLYPKPVKIGIRAVAWTSTSIDKLIEDLTAQSAE